MYPIISVAGVCMLCLSYPVCVHVYTKHNISNTSGFLACAMLVVSYSARWAWHKLAVSALLTYCMHYQQVQRGTR